MANKTRSHLLELPTELRLKILDNLIIRPLPQLISTAHTAQAHSRGFTDGLGHVTFIQESDKWRSVSLAGPRGFSTLNTAVLRVCKRIHDEMSELLYSKIFFVINMQYLRPMASSLRGSAPAVVATSTRPSVFLRWLNHVHIRQHIRPEEDMVGKAEAMQSFLSCLNPLRKTTEVTLHFDSMWLFNDGEWPHKARPEYTWQMYSAEMARMNLGKQPQIRVSSHWVELEGHERFQNLARKIGGKINDPGYIYW